MFEGLRTDATKVAVASDPIIERFNVIKDISAGQITGFVDPFSDALFFSELKNDSATALTLLCQQARAESAKSAKIKG